LSSRPISSWSKYLTGLSPKNGKEKHKTTPQKKARAADAARVNFRLISHAVLFCINGLPKTPRAIPVRKTP
jgi:hypothetical protein